MPENLPSEDDAAENDAALPSSAGDGYTPPRTVTRRIPRRSVDSQAETFFMQQETTQTQQEQADPAITDPTIADPAIADPAIADPAVEDLAIAEPTANTQEPVEQANPEPPPSKSTIDTADSGVSADVGEQPTVSTRTGRIEIPVPSVVRARERAEIAENNPVVLSAQSLSKSYGQVLAAADVSFDVHSGSLTGVVGPNGAGKTTVLSMISGLNRPSSGRISVRDIDVWSDGPAAKRVIGSLPDRLRLFDRLTGGQLLYYAGVLQGLDQSTVSERVAELAAAFSLESALDRPVSDYSAGMQKKIGLACSMIHAPDVLVLDEPYETIDPVSASNVTEILEKYVAGGGSVIMSSHSLDLIQRICDHVVVIVDGSIVAQGTVDSVRDGVSLEDRFKHLTRRDDEGKGLEWLRGSSDSD